MHLWENLKSFYLLKPVFWQELWFWWYQSIFSRFLLILFLFCFWFAITLVKREIIFFSGGNHSLLFYRHAQSFCDFSYFCCGYIQPLSSLSDDEPGKRADQFGFEEVVTVKKEKNRWLEISIIFKLPDLPVWWYQSLSSHGQGHYSSGEGHTNQSR